jgi:hypothetical protein
LPRTGTTRRPLAYVAFEETNVGEVILLSAVGGLGDASGAINADGLVGEDTSHNALGGHSRTTWCRTASSTPPLASSTGSRKNPADEPAARVDGSFVLVILGETGNQGVDIMIISGGDQAVQPGFALVHSSPPPTPTGA